MCNKYIVIIKKNNLINFSKKKIKFNCFHKLFWLIINYLAPINFPILTHLPFSHSKKISQDLKKFVCRASNWRKRLITILVSRWSIRFQAHPIQEFQRLLVYCPQRITIHYLYAIQLRASWIISHPLMPRDYLGSVDYVPILQMTGIVSSINFFYELYVECIGS